MKNSKGDKTVGEKKQLLNKKNSHVNNAFIQDSNGNWKERW
jgi:hypothetical protein